MLACTARLPAAHPAAVGALGGPRWGEHLTFSLLHTLLDTHAEPRPPLPPPEYPSRTQSCFPVLWPSPPLLLPLPRSELRVWFSKSLLILRSPILGRQGCIYPREQQLATLQVPFPTATRLPGHELGLRQRGGMAGHMVGGGRKGVARLVCMEAGGERKLVVALHPCPAPPAKNGGPCGISVSNSSFIDIHLVVTPSYQRRRRRNPQQEQWWREDGRRTGCPSLSSSCLGCSLESVQTVSHHKKCSAVERGELPPAR